MPEHLVIPPTYIKSGKMRYFKFLLTSKFNYQGTYHLDISVSIKVGGATHTYIGLNSDNQPGWGKSRLPSHPHTLTPKSGITRNEPT